MDNQFFYRNIEIRAEEIDLEKRTISLIISTETPVKRWFGDEILLHGVGNIDFSRMNSALMNHNPDHIIGRVVNPILRDKKAQASIVFDEDEQGETAFKKVKSGSLKGASIGYIVEKFLRLQEGEEWEGFKGPAYIAKKTSIYEVSLTPIPADRNSGIGRDLSRSLEGIEIESSKPKSKEEVSEMDEKELRKIIEEEREKSAAQIVEMVRTTLAEDARPKMRISPEEGLDLLGRAGAISAEVKGKTADLIMGGKTKDEVTRFLFEEYGKKTKPDAVDPGAGGGDGTGLPAKPGAQAPIRSLKDISDDEFIAGITSPSGLSL